jgi:DNA-binding MarR family transcriptional regulator
MFNIVLSYKESDVLRAFGEPAKARAFEISSKTQMPPGEVTRILGKLAGKGFLKISESVADLTSTGREALWMLDSQTRRSAASSQPVLLTDQETADALDALNTSQTTAELERSIDEALGKLKQ